MKFFYANKIRSALFLAAVIFTPNAQAAAELVMVEETGCMWCARWNAQIAPIYPKTEAGKAAPLRRIDKNTPLPNDIKLARPVLFTPTFIILLDGIEAGRLEGYAGEDFFWSLLEQLLVQNDILVDGLQ